MTTAAWVFLALAGVFAVADWVAIIRGDRRLEYVAKPAATLGRKLRGFRIGER